VPVITIDVGGAAELVNNDVNGFNFEIGDPNSLAHILEKIAKNPGILNNIKNNIIRPRRVEEEAFDYEKIYETIKKDNAD
jgi:glycosyltransferase involved in cell wall biosynthesis